MAKQRALFSNRRVGENLNKGLNQHRAGRLAEASADNDFGRIHHRQGDLSNAIACYRRAVALQPGFFESHFNLATALFTSGQLPQAAESFRQAALLRPEDADTHYSLGVVLQHMGDALPASQAYERAIQLRPEFSAALGNLGHLHFALGDLAAAEQALRRCIAIEPANVNAHRNLVKLFVGQGNIRAALESCRAALALEPDHLPTMCDFGGIYLRAGDLRKAEVVFRRVTELDPGNVSAHCSLANALAKQGDLAGAMESTRKALTIDPTHAPALCDFGTLLDLLGDGPGATQCFQLALASRPGFTLARFNLGIQHLASGNFAEGWPAFEARWETPEFCAITARPALAQPQWHGEDITGSSILLYSEQGLGDTLQFVRYASMVADLAAAVVLRVQPPLLRLLQMFDPRITIASLDSDEGAHCHWQCSLMSLPAAFRTDLATIPDRIPYLRADSTQSAAWAQRPPARGLRVGLVWAGSPTHIRDRQRSIPLKQFASLTQLSEITFYSLQKGPAADELASTPATERIVDLSEHLQDFTDTAAIIANLDLVISVDTAVAHLSGAMGKPVWLLLPRVSEWRWLKDRAGTPWYPTMRLFRQTVAGRWEDLLDQVKDELAATSQQRRSALNPEDAQPAALETSYRSVDSCFHGEFACGAGENGTPATKADADHLRE